MYGWAAVALLGVVALISIITLAKESARRKERNRTLEEGGERHEKAHEILARPVPAGRRLLDRIRKRSGLRDSERE